MKLQLHKKIFIFVILINLAIAGFDLLSMKSGLFSKTVNDYVLGNFNGDWWSLFFYFNLISIILISLSYFWFNKRHDKSEAGSILFGSIICWFTFLPDLFFFLLQGKLPPNILPWLNNGIISGKILPYLGGQMTNWIMYGFVLVGLFISYKVIKFMVKKL